VEGPNLRGLPRTLFSCPMELRVGDQTLRREQAHGNLSTHGLFLCAEQLPAGTPVHVHFTANPPADMDGVVRFRDADGIGIEFTAVSEADRRSLDALIAEFTENEFPSA